MVNRTSRYLIDCAKSALQIILYFSSLKGEKTVDLRQIFRWDPRHFTLTSDTPHWRFERS